MLTTAPCRTKILAVVALALLTPAVASAQLWPSTDLLVPWFEVELDGHGQTTLFSVCNSFPSEVQLTVSVYTNWGIEVLETQLVLGPDVLVPINLRDWILYGRLPDRQLSAEAIAHLQAALSGQRSPLDDLYYSTEVEPGVAVGSIRLVGSLRNGLWGDVFLVDPSNDSARGDMLVDLEPTPCRDCQTTCTTHGVRFLEGGALDSETELVVWSSRGTGPQAGPDFPANRLLWVMIECYSEDGVLLETHELWLLPLERLKIGDLGFGESHGWMRITTEEPSYIGFHVSAEDRYSLTLETACLPPEEPAIQLEKFTNGLDADFPPGVMVALGGDVRWTYEITNVGQVPLFDIVLTDSVEGFIQCPDTSLEPGESMTCVLDGVASGCAYHNVATVQAETRAGKRVQDSDPSHYTVPQDASIVLEKKVNGLPADLPPGPRINTHDPVTFSYEVTNTGSVVLENVTVTDDVLGTVGCPKSVLVPGEMVICAVAGEAEPKQRKNVGTVTASTPAPCSTTVKASDPAHYYGWWPDVDIEKSTNGHDADLPPGPEIPVGGAVTWTYVVTNTGDETLVDVTVQDDKLGAISCPKTTLAQAESMTCVASGTATVGQYRNISSVVGTVLTDAFPGAKVSDEDPSHYLGVYEGTPSVDLEKWTNGADADDPPGVDVVVGSAVVWTYIVTNTGNMALTGVEVADDQLGPVPCPTSTLEPGESMTCTMQDEAGCGPYGNLASVTATGADGSVVGDSDPSHYHGFDDGAADVEKSTNGADADQAPGPSIGHGTAVAWEYVVTNTGATPLADLSVVDDQLGPICTIPALAVGASASCNAAGTAITGQYSNLATVTARTVCEAEVEDQDPSHYFGTDPDIDIEKHTNGFDADEPPGPEFRKWEQIVWTYIVTNTGNVPLVDVTVTDDQGVAVSCPKSILAPGETMICQAFKAKGVSLLAKCVYCQYVNIGTVVGTAPDGTVVTDSDPSHHRYECDEGDEGCTPGYWKNHLDSWAATGYLPSQSVASVFAQASAYAGLASATLVQALGFGGGPGLEGAAMVLLRAGVAALLDASHPGVSYPASPAQVMASVDAALASGNRDTMLTVASQLDGWNNLGCPLS